MQKNKITLIWFAAIGIILITSFESCKKKSSSTNSTTDDLAVYKKIYGATDIYKDGDYVVIKTTGISDHKSPYYKGTSWESTKYEAYNGSNASWSQNPNKIAQINYTFRIPLNPKEASTKTATPMGPMGVSLNGVPLFNQYAAGHVKLTGEINSFDQYNGHPAPGGDYHYHVEPLWLTTKNGKSSLIGFLLDGFPVYGPEENGKTITNSDLDIYHGHTSVTADYPKGIYHYHITAADPYINGDNFFGTAGTVSK
jgi:hypothetical protein